jgi:tetratricopeptide (TPR) repeat protein
MIRMFYLIATLLITYAGYSQTAEEYFNKGLEKASGRDYTGAITEYTKAIKPNPKHASAFNARGNARTSIKDYNGAISDFSKALEIYYNYADAYYGRGLTKVLTGHIDSGCLVLKKARELGFADAFEAIKKYCDQ